MNGLKLVAAAVVTVAVAFPASASADSIVYLDGGNIVSASPDGSRKVQLTDQGDWHSVTQADDGTIAASRGSGSIEVLARDGRPLRSIATQPAPTGNGGTHRGTPINLAFSPDGRTIAYEYFDVTCPPASSCPSEQHSVLYTSADGPQASAVGVHGQQFGRKDPSFVSNGRALVFGGYGRNVNLDDLGGGNDSNSLWFTRETPFSDGEVSRDGTRIVLKVGTGADTRLGWLIVRGGNPATATPSDPTTGDTVCGSSPDVKLAQPTWSPDGNATAYGSAEGVQIVRFSAYAPGNCGVAGESILSATGSEPDWGPADPPAARWRASDAVTAPPAPVTPAPAPVVNPQGQPGGATAGDQTGAAAEPRIVTRAATRAALRRGLAVTLRVNRPGTVSIKLLDGKRRVASGSATARREGSVTVKLSKVSASKARRLRGKRLRVAVTAGGVATTATLRVR